MLGCGPASLGLPLIAIPGGKRPGRTRIWATAGSLGGPSAYQSAG